MSEVDRFMSREEFERLKAADEIKPDALFPIMDYAFCKHVWENSPLIQCLIKEATKP